MSEANLCCWIKEMCVCCQLFATPAITYYVQVWFRRHRHWQLAVTIFWDSYDAYWGFLSYMQPTVTKQWQHNDMTVWFTRCTMYMSCYIDRMLLLCSTCAFLMRHLSRMASLNEKTGMTCKNLAIVWAPNLLRYLLHLKIVTYWCDIIFKIIFAFKFLYRVDRL